MPAVQMLQCLNIIDSGDSQFLDDYAGWPRLDNDLNNNCSSASQRMFYLHRHECTVSERHVREDCCTVLLFACVTILWLHAKEQDRPQH